MSTLETIVVVGAGHAGVQAAASLREEGFAGQIELVSGEHALPYQRPPLSKKFMTEQMAPSDLLLRGEQFYADKDIGLRLGDKVLEIDRADKSVQLASGARLAYDHLILATGSKPRSTDLVGAELDGVQRLCDVDDAIRLRQALRRVGNVVIVGAGFIGLEIAATATAMGTAVHVVEWANRPMARVVSEPVSSFFANMHCAAGVQLSLGVSVAQIIGSEGRVKQIQLSDGRQLPADIVILGIGAQARDELGSAAGLACGNGIEVNEMMTTSDPSISAIGDCALHQNSFAGNRPFRLESIQNAVDQGRVVARKLVNKPARYDTVPWFWSDQAHCKLQIAGLAVDCDRVIIRGDQSADDFAVYSFQGERLRCVETVNRSGEHMAARRLIGANVSVTPEQVAASDFDPREKARQVANPAAAA